MFQWAERKTISRRLGSVRLREGRIPGAPSAGRLQFGRIMSPGQSTGPFIVESVTDWIFVSPPPPSMSQSPAPSGRLF